jgi:hypothetical protein
MKHPVRVVALTALAGILVLPAVAQVGEFQSVEYDPAKITEEMRATTEVIAQAIDIDPPAGWKRPGGVERYTVTNLYDKINGRSELYNSYDIVGMTFVTFLNEADSSKYIDIFLYDMRTAMGAYGVFSVERSPGNPHFDLGRSAYRTDRDLFLWKGQYYLTVLASDETDDVQNSVLEIAKTIEARLKDDGGSVWGLDQLPKEHRNDETIQYFQIDAMALSFMTNTFTAEYDLDGEEVTMFLSKQDDEAIAKEKTKKYVEYLEKYGDDVKQSDIGGATCASGDMGGGFFDAAFQIGPYIAGVSAVQGRETALEAAAWLFKELKAAE